MSFFEKLQGFLEKFIGPIAQKLNESDLIRGLSNGMMQTLPITLGVSVFAILVNLPITFWQTFLQNTGLYGTTQEILSATMSMLAIYIVISVSYSYTNIKKQSGLTAAIISTGAFLCLMPQSVEGKDGAVGALLGSYLGSNGIFVAIVTALVISSLYIWLMNKNLSIKLPDSVPPMVSQSLSPTFVSILIFTIVLAVKYLFTLTSYGNIFDFVTEVISKPVMYFGSSPWALIALYTFTNILWFFGIHPSPIVNLYTPVLIAAITADVEAYMNAEALPYLIFQVVFICMNLGGNGNTIGLAIDMLFAKSERFKTMSKLSIVPSIFNINEPMVFGVPLMLNPVFFIPMALTTPITGIISYVLCKVGLAAAFNPTISVPWIMPGPITGLLEGGILTALIVCACVAANVLLYFPFFRMADKQALREEQAA